jgi:hypothetical protein
MWMMQNLDHHIAPVKSNSSQEKESTISFGKKKRINHVPKKKWVEALDHSFFCVTNENTFTGQGCLSLRDLDFCLAVCRHNIHL